MKKLGEIGVIAMALVVGYVGRGAAGCSSAHAGGEGGATAECKCPEPKPTVPEVAIEKCVADASGNGSASHAYPGKKIADLASVSVVLVASIGPAPGTPRGTLTPAPPGIQDGLVTAECFTTKETQGKGGATTAVIFSLPH